MAKTIHGWNDYLDLEWLGRRREDPIDPEAPIIDPHHHMWSEHFPYEAEQLLEDLTAGHNVIATVYLEAHRGYHQSGPEHLRPAGETGLIAQLAESADLKGGAPRICAGIIGGGDLTADTGKVEELLDAHVEAGRGRFCGVRANIFIGFRPVTLEMTLLPGQDSIVDDPAFQRGVACLGRRGLALELVGTQAHLAHVARLAKRVPDAAIVMNHLFPIASLGGAAADREALTESWRRGIASLAPYPNVFMKLGGCANPMMAHSLPEFRRLRDQPLPPSSEELAELYRPSVSHAIETFGPERCMFESNFPPDKAYTSYVVLWNAFKRLAQGYSDAERHALLCGTASRVYGVAMAQEGL